MAHIETGWRKSSVPLKRWRVKNYSVFINGGMDEDQAKEKANTKTVWAVKGIFFKSCNDFLVFYLHLEDNDTHQDIISDLKENNSKGVDVNRALDRVIVRHQSKFDWLFQHLEEESKTRRTNWFMQKKWLLGLIPPLLWNQWGYNIHGYTCSCSVVIKIIIIIIIIIWTT